MVLCYGAVALHGIKFIGETRINGMSLIVP